MTEDFNVNYLIQNNKIDEAIVVVNKLLLKSELNSIEWLRLGVNFLKSDFYEIAMECLKKSISLNNNHYSAYTNIGVIYFKYFEDYEKAIYNFEKSIALNPNNPSALFNLGCCYADNNNNIKAINLFKKVVSLKTDHYRALHNLSLKQLSINNYEEGWKNYEARKKILNIKERLLGIPKDKIWNGITNEQTLVVHSEQGIGDEILISSLYNDLKFFHKEIIISCDKRLIKLFSDSFLRIKFFDKKTIIRTNINSKHVFSFSLGQFLRKNKKNFNNKNPWIKTNPLIDLRIKKKFSYIKNKKIGIAWKSDSNDKKNISLKEIIKFLPEKNYEIVNLQYGEVEKEISEIETIYKRKIIFFKNIDYKNDLDSLYSIIQQCDLIITTSNVTAHFAGSLSKKTFLLLNFNAFWYWGHKKNTIWYPNTRIFKQIAFDDWDVPLKNLKLEINNF